MTSHYISCGLLLMVWIVWWLCGVNWSKAWPVLETGAWVPLTLLVIVVALAWSQLFAGDALAFGFLRVANFWWQLITVGFLVSLALFCGWLQGYLRWTPAEISVEPEPATHGHGHDHSHH